MDILKNGTDIILKDKLTDLPDKTDWALFGTVIDGKLTITEVVDITPEPNKVIQAVVGSKTGLITLGIIGISAAIFVGYKFLKSKKKKKV